MSRSARVVIPGVPHHVTHRGNNKQDVFFVDDDRRAYLKTLREHCDRYAVELHGYCLMTNHVHFVVTPKSADGLARAIGAAHVRHSAYIIVRRAWNDRWSSAAAHLDGHDASGMLDRAAWRKAARGLDWERQLVESEDEETREQIRRCTWTGHPLGSDRFVAELETFIGRRLRARSRGRPRKSPKKPRRARRKGK